MVVQTRILHNHFSRKVVADQNGQRVVSFPLPDFFSTASSNLLGIKPDSIILELKVPGPVPGGLCSIRWLDVGAA